MDPEPIVQPVGLPLRRGDGSLPEELDRPVALAALEADGEAGKDAGGAQGRHPELLPHPGADGW